MAGGDGVEARNGLEQFALAAACDARDAEHLARVDGEADIVQTLDAKLVVSRQAFDDEALFNVLRLGAADVQAHRVADHHVGQRLLVGVLGGDVTDVFALAQHGHAVGHVEHLVQLMRDDNEGLAVGLHVAHDGEELVRLLRGEHCGRLVQNEDVRPAVEHLDDLDGLLLRNGHVVDLLIGVDVEPVFVADLFDLFAGFGNVELAFKAEDDILRCGEKIDELEVLVDHTDAVFERILGGGDRDGFAVNVDLPLVGEIDAGEHVHQRRLAAAVFAEQRQDLALVQLKVDGVVRHHFAEPLRDILHFNCACSSQGGHPFFRWRAQEESPAALYLYKSYISIIERRCKCKTEKNTKKIRSAQKFLAK